MKHTSMKLLFVLPVKIPLHKDLKFGEKKLIQKALVTGLSKEGVHYCTLLENYYRRW